MVDMAHQGGASAVKFQMRTPKEVYAPTTEKGAYFYESDNRQWLDRVYGKHRETLEFSYAQWESLFEHCRKAKITAFATPFDKSSVDRLDSLGVAAFKIASGDATNIPLIQYAASKGKPLIISTGGCDLEDVKRIRRGLLHPLDLTGDLKPISYALLQCSCIYPAPDDIMNLRVIETYREMFPRQVIGLSSHNRSWHTSFAAYMLGARIFEHHFTNDQAWQGTDNHFSLRIGDLRDFVDACESARKAMGSSVKSVDPREADYATERQKSLYWARDIEEGVVVTEGHLIALCPGGGIPPYLTDRFLGKTVGEHCQAGTKVEEVHVTDRVPVHAS
jgi:N-acetylneuraminate synthase/sialic acid synthase